VEPGYNLTDQSVPERAGAFPSWCEGFVRTKTPLQAEKILDAAAHLFGSQRFHEVRMDDIAAEADVGKGTLYRYFEDKEELYLALLFRASEQFLRRVKAEMDAAAGPRARLEAAVSAIVTYFDEQPHLCDLIQRAEVHRPTGVEFPWQQVRDEMHQIVLGLFEEARGSGDFVVRDPELMLLMLLGGLRSVIRFSKPPRAEDFARQIVTNFLEGAAPPRDEISAREMSHALVEKN
jgi:AcrR family transcriptional regulator